MTQGTPLALARASIGIGIAVLGLKTLAWWLTGSVALLSDALESMVNIATAIAALIAIRIAALPADANHPFGHHKAEFFSAVLEGVMIVIAALLILREAVAGLRAPVQIDAPLEGLAVTLVATVINALWARILIRGGRRARSPALTADGRHLMADVATSAGVAAGLLLAMATGWWRLDALIAVAVAVNVLWSGWALIRESVGGLMDEAAPDDTVRLVREVIAAEAGGAIEAHDLRTRAAGAATFVQFHLVVPGETTVYDAHEICDRIEASLRASVEGVKITIHVEPDHKTKDDPGAIQPDAE